MLVQLYTCKHGMQYLYYKQLAEKVLYCWLLAASILLCRALQLVKMMIIFAIFFFIRKLIPKVIGRLFYPKIIQLFSALAKCQLN